MFGAPAGGVRFPSTSAFSRNTAPSMTTHCSAAGSPFSIFARSAMHTCFCVTISGSGSSLVLVGL
jgi:hypothetical protein